MEDAYYLISSLEDIIATYSKTPSLLYEKLSNFVKKNPQEIKKSLEVEMVFGDEKLTQLVRDVTDGKPISPSVVTGLDFSELSDLEDKVTSDRFGAELSCPLTEEHFRALLLDPLFVTDWDHHKHEMVDSFNYPDTLVDANNITNSDSLDVLCSPVTVSIIKKCKLQDSEILTEDNPISRAANDVLKFFPTIEEYVNQVNGTLADSKVEAQLVSEATNIIESPIRVGSIHEDFSIFGKIKTKKGLEYVLKLLRDKKPENFSVKEGISALAKLASTVDAKDIGKLNHDKEIPTGDTAQKRGGSSAPRNQGGGIR